MIRNIAILLAMLTGSIQAWGIPLIDQNAHQPPRAYVFLQSEIIDPNLFFAQYAVPAEVEVVRYKGAPLVATFDRNVIEGEWNNNWTLLLVFPTLQSAHDWYNSEGYQAVVGNRHAATAFGNLIFFEGIPEGTVSWRIDSYEGSVSTLSEPLTLDTSPDHIATLSIEWQDRKARTTVSAGFEPVDVSGAILSFDYLLDNDELMNCRIQSRIRVGDTSGATQTIAREDLIGGEWRSISVPMNEVGGRVDLTRADEVLFDIHKKGGQSCDASSLKIRKLLIE